LNSIHHLAESMSGKYSPRVAIVTGGSQGIGYSIVLRLADDGLDIAVNDIASKVGKIEEVVEEIKKKGRRAIAIPGDVSKEADVQAMIEKTVQELGSLDVMVANAGIAPGAPFLETTVEQLDAINAVNIRGTFICYKYAALQMIKQGNGGRLIGASSSAGKQGTPHLTAYSGSKFAVRGITQTAAVELVKHGITANAYAPGIIHTPLALLADGKDDRGATAKKLFGLPPDAPDAEPEVVASIVSYLAKPESYFINGQTISVDGGIRLS